ncbi:MAG TPA: hypothetical protein VFQ53_36495 [Kofleriaceae bacterium]|nr:hypothetical protein [Kofleriaceae bacterium]
MAALAACSWTGCKDKDKTDAAKTAGATDLDSKCQHVAVACGDKDKHVEKITADCKAAAKQQVEKGCTDKAVAVYDCYEKQLCGKADKVWALDDLRVLADRQKQCVAERTALSACTGK